MPLVYSAISEQTDHIYDVIAKQLAHKIIRDLNPLTNMEDKIYIDTGYSAPQSTTDGDNNSILRNNKLIVKATPNTNPTSLKWDNITGQHVTGQYINSRTLHNQFNMLFADKAVGIFVREMTIPTVINLEFELELVSRDQAYEIPAQLFRRYAVGQVFTEALTYDYPIPNDVLTLLFSLYKMRRLTSPKTFPEYIGICSNNKFTYNVSRADQRNLELTVPKTMINSICTLEYNEDKPEEVKVNRSANAYQTKFNIVVQFERADMIMMQYPCVIDNQLIPANMIPAPKTTHIESLDGPFPTRVFNEAAKVYSMARPSEIRMPYYDDWLIPNSLAKSRSYKEFLTAIFLVDEENPNKVTEIPLGGDLGDGDQLHPIVKNLLKLQGNESFQTDCIFHIDVFWGDQIIEPATLSLSEDLILRIPCKDINKTHRIVISEITDLKYLNPKWLPYLVNECPYFLLCPTVVDLINKGLLVIKDGTLFDPKKNIIGGSNDSYWPLRIIRADIIAKHQAERNRQNPA